MIKRITTALNQESLQVY